MLRSDWNILLIVALVAMGAFAWLGRVDTHRRNFEYFPDMVRSARYNTFAPNPNFTDGKTLQPPVTGTVPIADPAAPKGSFEGDLVPRPGAAEMSNPFTATDAAALARGRAVFDTFCQPCHGAGGAGDGIIVQHGYPAPPTLLHGGATELSDSALFQVVSKGSGEMPPYGAQIAPSDRWKLVLHLRSLQQRAATAASGPSDGASR